LVFVLPVNPGVGIGVEDDNTSTGSLGCVVKHNETGEVCILTCDHVVRREGRAELSVVQPSLQDYEESLSESNKGKEECSKKIAELKAKIPVSEHDTKRLEAELKTQKIVLEIMERKLQLTREQQCPIKIGTFSSRAEHFARTNDYECKASSKRHGIDAAIVSIEHNAKEKLLRGKARVWPDDLKDEGGNTVEEIKLNGNVMTKEELEKAMASQSTVYKHGRTTGLTQGRLRKKLEDIDFNGDPRSDSAAGDHSGEAPNSRKDNVWRNVIYVEAIKENEIGERCFSDDGDSGAVVFDEEGTLVGLLFGSQGTQRSRGDGLATLMYVVCEALNITPIAPP
jgi:hypothetical protein